VDLRIAVIMPAYNVERYIEAALDSVAAQERLPEEVVVVDDGSTDRTSDVVVRWRDQHELNVKLIRQPNAGSATARNTAIDNTDADLLAWLDADDLWLPHHLRTLEEGFRLDPELVVCFADADCFEDSRILKESYLRGSPLEDLEIDQNGELRVFRQSPYRAMVNGTNMATCSQLVSREAVLNVGGFDPELRQSQDLDLPLRLSRVGRFGYFPVIVGRMRRHDTNTTHRRNRLRHLGYKLKVLEKMLAQRQQLHLTDGEVAATQQALESTVQRMLRHASQRGPTLYWQYYRDFRDKGYVTPIGSGRHLLRSLFHLRATGARLT
jgi:glycosyltransferase involved in cell wall biosynthesis